VYGCVYVGLCGCVCVFVCVCVCGCVGVCGFVCVDVCVCVCFKNAQPFNVKHCHVCSNQWNSRGTKTLSVSSHSLRSDFSRKHSDEANICSVLYSDLTGETPHLFA
jgi:hypothetical protein